VAANMPDLDFAYSGITPQPLGYLLHHRGHTHTVLGLAVLALGLVMIYRLLPAVGKLRPGDRLRLWGIIAVALGSHVALDALNSYGVHPFYPFESKWYFGDAVFIFEPWLWCVLGMAVAWNTRSGIARLAAALPLLIFPVTMVSMGIVPMEGAASLALIGLLSAGLASRMSAKMRAGVALAASVLIVGALLGISRLARSEAVEALRPELRGRLVDVILTPNPSSPLCWAVIGVELDEAGGEYVLWRGTMSLAPRWKAPIACASHGFAASRAVLRPGGPHFALRDEVRQPLGRLRDLARNDCRVRAWLRFGRAPVIAGGAIFDLRFAERLGQNFSHMPLAANADAAPCPSNVPAWDMPRADLLNR
jgi:inner membrane protein